VRAYWAQKGFHVWKQRELYVTPTEGHDFHLRKGEENVITGGSKKINLVAKREENNYWDQKETHWSLKKLGI